MALLPFPADPAGLSWTKSISRCELLCASPKLVVSLSALKLWALVSLAHCDEKASCPLHYAPTERMLEQGNDTLLSEALASVPPELSFRS